VQKNGKRGRNQAKASHGKRQERTGERGEKRGAIKKEGTQRCGVLDEATGSWQSKHGGSSRRQGEANAIKKASGRLFNHNGKIKSKKIRRREEGGFQRDSTEKTTLGANRKEKRGSRTKTKCGVTKAQRADKPTGPVGGEKKKKKAPGAQARATSKKGNQKRKKSKKSLSTKKKTKRKRRKIFGAEAGPAAAEKKRWRRKAKKTHRQKGCCDQTTNKTGDTETG